MKLFRSAFTFLILCCLSNVLFAQNTEALWLDYNPHFNINDRIEYYGDLGYRTILQDNTGTRYNIRPSIRYKRSDKWEFKGGIGLFYGVRPSITNRFEIRPFQGVQFNIDPINPLRMNVYVRMEERISFDDLEEDEVGFDLRFRARLSGKYEFLNASGDNYWFLPYSIEVFIPVNNDLTELVREKARGFIGIGYNANETWRYTFRLNYEVGGGVFSQNSSINNVAFQLKVRHQINWNE